MQLLDLKEQKQEGKKSTEQGTVKPLYIKDFVSSNKLVLNDFEEKELFVSEGAASIVMRTPTSKIRPENVTVPQWVSANMRMFSALLERGDIANRKQVLEYIKYTEEIGEYFQIYSIPSVMLYDHSSRERQAKENIPWGTPYVHSVNYYLRSSFYTRSINQDKTSIPAKSTRIPNVQKDNNGENICRDYQAENGCRRRVCKFSYVCTVCNEKHPEYLHKLIKGK